MKKKELFPRFKQKRNKSAQSNYNLICPFYWRRGRDLNPRAVFTANTLAGCPIRPLWHLSINEVILYKITLKVNLFLLQLLLPRQHLLLILLIFSLLLPSLSRLHKHHLLELFFCLKHL
ncbi:MAG: hypothetical protein XD75_0208 [Parcubacteria bacterium 33_209]|nr:MAG: hypothetical protein XD75_0208 [Parcubacteria bacterium 33_209]